MQISKLLTRTFLSAFLTAVCAFNVSCWGPQHRPDSELLRAQLASLEQENVRKQSVINELESVNYGLRAQLSEQALLPNMTVPTAPELPVESEEVFPVAGQPVDDLVYYQTRANNLENELNDLTRQLGDEAARSGHLTLQLRGLKDLADESLPMVQYFMAHCPENHPLKDVLSNFQVLLGNNPTSQELLPAADEVGYSEQPCTEDEADFSDDEVDFGDE